MEIYHAAPLTKDYVCLIDERKTIAPNKKKIIGCVNINGHKLEVGDIIDSCFITTTAKQGTKWKVTEILRRFYFKGRFERDMSECGFEAIVEQ